MTELFEKLTGVTAASRDLGDRGILELTGSDRVRFLEGMVSNEVGSLATGETCYATLLNRKGRLLADLGVLALEEAFLLDTAVGRGGTVLEALERYIVADDVTLEDLSSRWGHLAFEGPGVRDVLGDLAPPPPGRFRLGPWRGEPLLWLGGGSLTTEGAQVLGPRGSLDALLAELALPELPEEQAEVLRIEAFQPAYGIDMTERNFPAEARLDHAISYTKGCFIGQEIVARIRSRGAVNRLLVQIHTEAPVERGDAIQAAEGRAGEITSAALSPSRGPLALGYVPAAQAAPGTELDVAGVPGVVLGPPLDPS